MADRSAYRDAIRILFVLVKGADPLAEAHPTGATYIFRGEARLYALEFWMRNPDYLAEELLDKFDQTGSHRFLRAAEAILSSDEPDIRRLPMIRYRFGAFEQLDDALGLLRSRNLVRITGERHGDRVLETDFLIMPAAVDLVEEIRRDFPVLEWYAQRATLVVEIAAGRGGRALKERQYEQAEYAETQMGGVIPPIAKRVRERLVSVDKSMLSNGVTNV